MINFLKVYSSIFKFPLKRKEAHWKFLHTTKKNLQY